MVYPPAVATSFPGLVPAGGDDDTTATPGKDAGAGTDSSTSTDSGTDSPTTPDSGQDTGTDSAVPVKCTQTEFDAPCGMQGGDCTAQNFIDIAFPTDATPKQYVNNCVKVKVGTDIDFAGDFTKHPLEPAGGDTPTPIPNQTTNPPNGTSGMPELIIKMNTKGTYGFQCGFHPTVMYGAIQVVD